MNKNIAEWENDCRASALYAWSHGLDRCEEFAQVIYLCPTNVCNHVCVTCGYPLMRKGRKPDGSKQQGLMDMDLFRHIVDQLPPGQRRLYLQKTGEPLLHRKITDMMDYVRRVQPDYELAMHSNASRLTPAVGEAILRNLDFFSISIFGFDRETYEKVHGRDDFERVLENVRGFRQQYLAAPRRPKVYFDVVRNVHIQDLTDQEIFSRLEKEFPEFNVGIHFPFNFQGLVKEYDMKVFQNLERERFPRCIWPWGMIAILWDGQIGYCVGDPLEQGILGDVRQETVVEAWNNDRYRAYRRDVVERNWEALAKRGIHCGTCNWIFALKSQSMENLCLSARAARPAPEAAMATDVVTRVEDLLSIGFVHYRRGNVVQALKSFTLAEVAARQEPLRQTAAMWRENVVDVFRMRGDLEYWEEALNKEGLSLSTVHVTHYRLSEDQMAKVASQHRELDGGLVVKATSF